MQTRKALCERVAKLPLRLARTARKDGSERTIRSSARSFKLNYRPRTRNVDSPLHSNA